LLVAVLIAPFETGLIGFARFKALRRLKGLLATMNHARITKNSNSVELSLGDVN
jgi:hypothetical protein